MKTCEERIDREYQARRDHILTLINIIDEPCGEDKINFLNNLGYNLEPDDGEDVIRDVAMNELYNLPLNISRKEVVKIEFSWGGPSDFVELDVYGNEVVSGTYHFQDWFDGAIRNIDKDLLYILEEYFVI